VIKLLFLLENNANRVVGRDYSQPFGAAQAQPKRLVGND
jgi:hypothetical protein